jgi:hypothetical protein
MLELLKAVYLEAGFQVYRRNYDEWWRADRGYAYRPHGRRWYAAGAMPMDEFNRVMGGLGQVTA